MQPPPCCCGNSIKEAHFRTIHQPGQADKLPSSPLPAMARRILLRGMWLVYLWRRNWKWAQCRLFNVGGWGVGGMNGTTRCVGFCDAYIHTCVHTYWASLMGTCEPAKRLDDLKVGYEEPAVCTYKGWTKNGSFCSCRLCTGDIWFSCKNIHISQRTLSFLWACKMVAGVAPLVC